MEAMHQILAKNPFSRQSAFFKCKIGSALTERDKLIEKIQQQLITQGAYWHDFWDRLVLDEMIVNAIVHGNSENKEKIVKVSLFYKKSLWAAEIADQGSGFDWQAIPKRLDAGLENESGRGWTLILGSGANLYFSGRGNKILVVRSRYSYPEEREKISTSKSISKFLTTTKKYTDSSGWAKRSKIQKHLGIAQRTLQRHIQLARQAQLVSTKGRGQQQQIKILAQM